METEVMLITDIKRVIDQVSREKGIEAVFGPGSSTEQIAEFIQNHVEGERH